ncbi:MAG TPA: flagellar biosynthesis anti-sigma factor FlgM [Terriglobales bacterium]|nr:flagellar biosynthesis anti-sigma factor FlgM [Terriglobales bacterium]
MRIDPNHGPQPARETNSSTAQNPAASASPAELGEDQAQLSGAHTQIQALATQAAQLPEVRQERVQALRQAIQGGRYATTPEQVAGAVFGHMLSGSAA